MKFRKLTALAVALALLAVPVLSLGEEAAPSYLDQAFLAGRNVKTTITFIPGEMMTQDPTLALVADVLKVLRIETSAQEQEGKSLEQLELFLQDKSSLSLKALTGGGQFYLMSNLLGDQTLSFTPEEFANLYVKLMEASSGTKLSEEQLALIKASMASYEDALSGKITSSGLPDFDMESLKSGLEDPLTAMLTDIQAKAEVTSGTFEGDNHDPAVSQKVYTVSAQQLTDALKIVCDWALQEDNLDKIMKMASSSMQSSGQTVTKEEFAQALQQLPEEFAKAVPTMLPNPITVTELTDADGAVKSLQVKGKVVAEDSQNIDLSFGKYVKTEADGTTTLYALDMNSAEATATLSLSNKEIPTLNQGDASISASQWKLWGSASESGADLGSFSLAFEQQTSSAANSVDGVWKVSVEANISGMPLSGNLTGTEKATFDGTDAKADGTVSLYLMGSEQPACTVVYTTASGEPQPLPTVSADSVHLGAMTNAELGAWWQTASMTVMGQLMTAMGNLPDSIKALLGGGQGVAY